MPEASGVMSPGWTYPPWEAPYSECAGHGMHLCCRSLLVELKGYLGVKCF